MSEHDANQFDKVSNGGKDRIKIAFHTVLGHKDALISI